MYALHVVCVCFLYLVLLFRPLYMTLTKILFFDLYVLKRIYHKDCD